MPSLAPAGVAAPDLLPGLPNTGYGIPTVPVPPGAAGGAQGPLAIPSATGLGSPYAGLAGLPTTGPRGPAWLIQPSASVGETFTDNVLQTSTHRIADAITRLTPNIAVLTDTPRLQGTLSAGLEYDKYAVVGAEDRILGNFYSSDLATVVPDALFVDVRSALTETSGSGAVGFVNLSQIPRSQLEQVFTTTVSPFYRHSFRDLADAELRYRFTSTNISGGNLLSSTTATGLPLAADTIGHEVTATLATGERFQRLSSRLTLDGAKIDSASNAQSTQLNAYDDLQYHFNDTISALGRIGYQHFDYPLAPAANIDSPSYLIGGRIDFGPRGYASLQYGRQDAANGFTGSARYDVTPYTSINAAVSQGRSTPQQQIGNALGTSALTPVGTLINQNTGLPISLTNSQFALQNTIFSFHNYSAGITSTVAEVNTLSLFVSYQEQVAQAGGTGSSNSTSVVLTWGRALNPDLSSNASLGYISTKNATLGNIPGPGNNSEEYHANIGLSYLIGYNLTGSVVYTFDYRTNPIPGLALANSQSGSVIVNQLELTLNKAF